MKKVAATAMMSLGRLVFRMPGLVPQEADRAQSVRHAKNERIGAADAFQFIGPGDDTITLNGVALEGLHDTADERQALSDLMTAGRAHPLVDGSGRVIGQFIITGINEKHSLIGAAGAPKKTAWSISLQRVDPGPRQLTKPANPIANPKLSIKTVRPVPR